MHSANPLEGHGTLKTLGGMSRRDLLIVMRAVPYMQANLDGVNEAFEEDEDQGLVVALGGDLVGPAIDERGVADLLARLEEVADNP